jgi:Uma2 family endonuclease
MNLNPFDVLPQAEPDLEKGFEWVDDRAVAKPMGTRASEVAGVLFLELGNHVRTHKPGHAFLSECAYQIFPLKPRQIRKPDLSFVAKGRLPNEEVPSGNRTIPPDLAVEVISPNDIAEEFEQRVDELMSAGLRLLWVIYPATRSAWVLRKDGADARLTENQELSGEDVVPGFTCKLSTLFQGL